jgi:hypothetical protein
MVRVTPGTSDPVSDVRGSTLEGRHNEPAVRDEPTNGRYNEPIEYFAVIGFTGKKMQPGEGQHFDENAGRGKRSQDRDGSAESGKDQSRYAHKFETAHPHPHSMWNEFQGRDGLLRMTEFPCRTCSGVQSKQRLKNPQERVHNE